MVCCNPENSYRDFTTQCNACGKIGKPVKKKTLEHLLKEDRVSLIRDTQYSQTNQVFEICSPII
jgi:hypothetical protein